MSTNMVRQRWRDGWYQLIRPTASIQAEEQRQQASLLAALSIALLLVGTIIITFWVLANPDFKAAPYISMGILSAIGLTYTLSRTRGYRIGAFILVGMLLLTVGVTIFTAPGPMTERMLALNFLVAAILLTSILATVRATFFVSGLCVIITALFFYAPGVPFAVAYSYLVFVVVMSALLIVATIIRNTYQRARREAETALRQSEAQYRQVFETNQAVKLIINPADSCIVAANQAACRFYGYPLDVLTSLRISDINTLPPVKIQQEMERAKHEERLYFNFRHRLASGEVRDVEVFSGPVVTSDGPLLYSIIHDITQRKQAEAALRLSEERFRNLFENSPDAIFVQDLAGMVLDVNPAACRLQRLARQHLIGKNARELVPPDEREEVARRFPELARGERDRLEGFSWTEAGQVTPVEIRASRLDYAGQPAVLLHVRDVTERIQLQERQARLATAVEQTAESVVITDTHGHIVYVNPAFERITGFRREEALGRNPRLLKSGKQDAAVYQELWATIGAGQVWQGHLINKKKDGSLYTENVTISPVRDEKGAIVNYVAVKRDVTRELQLEEQLIQAQKMEAVGRLAGGIAHDFNNILTVIMGNNELALAALGPDDPLYKDIEQSQKAAKRAAALTRQLLAFSRKQLLQPRTLNLNTLVTDLEKMLRRLIGEHVELVVRLEPALGLVKADPGQVEQVILNLAINARDVMPQGGQLTLETANLELAEAEAQRPAGRKTGSYVLLAVSDTGPGIAAETQAHLFEPFFTTKEIGQGTGLGLAIVHGVVEQSGGYIQLHSELGQGATFKICLPRVEAERPLTGQQPTSAAPCPGSETILLVEDEETVRDLAGRILAECGYTVLTARQGREALLLSQGYRAEIHLLLTDMLMPGGLNGRQLAEQLLSLRPQLKVLYMSGYADNIIAHHDAQAAGMAFLYKPFTPEVLTQQIRQVLDGGC